MRSSTKVGLLQDLHIGVRGSEVFRSFIKSYLVDYALPYFHSQGVTDILQGGDLMDSRVRLLAKDRDWMVKELIPKLKELNMTIHALSGNHDLGNKDDLEISWVDWISCESKGSIIHYKEPQDLTLGDTTFSMISWVCKANYGQVVDYIKNTTASVAIMHAELEGFKLAKNSLCTKGTLDKELLSKYDQVYSSHFHQESRSANIHYLGMNFHLDWGSVEEDPTKGLYIYDTLSGALSFKENPVGMTLFKVIDYDYEDIESAGLVKEYNDSEYLSNVVGLEDSVIKVNVLNRDNSSHYKKFVNTLKLIKCVNYNILDMTKQLDLVEQKVDQKKWDLDPLAILLDKVDSTDGDNFNHEGVAIKLKEVYNRCKDNSNLV